jgi:hypothetical protein
MKERTSKIILFIESLVFLVPVSLLTLFYALFLIPLYRSGLASEPWEAQAVPVFTLLGLVLQLCGWRVIAAFLVDGRDGLRRISKRYIYAIILGAALVALSGLVVLLMLLEFELPDSFGLLSANYLALPALIPFTHIMLERWRSQRTDVDEPI